MTDSDRYAANKPLVRKFGSIVDLTNEEIDQLERLHERAKSVSLGTELVGEGEPHEVSMIVEEGWACRYKMLSDGRRQIINFLLPGDIIGPFACVIETSDHAVLALTRLIVATFEPQSIIELFATCPRLGALYGWAVGRDDAIVSEHVVRVGRRSAYERMAHLLLELQHRLQQIDPTDDPSFEMPLTQELLADALGLSLVHVNRTLRRLRVNGHIRMLNGMVSVPNTERLRAIAEFSPEYLEPEKLPEETSAGLSKL